ncbi:MAG: hypothetical protein MK086_05410 [Flavobacteriales bacterium]|nr:hypothetical protein [Flavobacteriales bacterium]
MLVYFAQLSFLLGNRPLTYLMVAYLAVEFLAIVCVYTMYHIKKDKHILSNILNIPGAMIFTLFFLNVGFTIGQAIGEIPPTPKYKQSDTLQPFVENWAPIAINFVVVLAAMYLDVKQLRVIRQFEFLDREFRFQTLMVLGVLALGIISCIAYDFDARIPIIVMGVSRLLMEFYSERRHVKLKQVIRDKISGFNKLKE